MRERHPFVIADPFRNRAWFWIAFFALFAAFFACDHDVRVSLADAFTGTADEMEQQAAGGNFVRRFAFLSIAGLGLLGLMLPSDRRLGTPTPLLLAPLAAYFVWCLLSIAWSDNPSMTLRRCLVLTCLVLGGGGLVKQLTLREFLHLAWSIPLAYLVIGIGAEVALGTFRPWAGDYRFSGTVHPNTQGLSLATLCLASFCLARESQWRKRGYLFVFAVGFLFLMLTKSRTSFAGLVLAITLLLTLRTASGLKWSVGLGGIWTVATLAVIVLLFNIDVEEQLTDLALMGRKEQAESLTGRMPIWTVLSDYVAARPIVGYGYESFWTPDRIDTVSSELHWGIREAHSAYLDTILGVGLIGGMLLLTAIFAGVGLASKQYLQTGHPAFGWSFGLLVFGLINGCTESGMMMPMFVPFLAVCGLLQVATFASVFQTSHHPEKHSHDESSPTFETVMPAPSPS